MHQQINKKKIYFYIFTFLLLSTLFNQKFILFFKNNFLLKNILVETDNLEIKKKIKSSSYYLLNKNILFISKKEIQNNLKNLKFLENINVKKKFPSTIIITAKKTNLLAYTFINQKKYYIGENNQFIPAKKLKIKKEIPVIFGRFSIYEFINLKRELNLQKINDNEIIKYYWHKNNRWDLYFKNNIIIKLPEKNYNEAIKIYKQFIINNQIKSNSVIDLRIANRLILKNE